MTWFLWILDIIVYYLYGFVEEFVLEEAGKEGCPSRRREKQKEPMFGQTCSAVSTCL